MKQNVLSAIEVDAVVYVSTEKHALRRKDA